MSQPLQENPVQARAPELEPEIERGLLRAYIDSINDGIFVVCDEMKFHVANPLLVEWLGVDEAELTAHGRRMPIKIDGALVRNIVEDAADFAMVDAINRIGGAMGLKTIAEFVETAACLQRLRDIGIDYAQGYAIHRPEPLFAVNMAQPPRCTGATKEPCQSCRKG